LNNKRLFRPQILVAMILIGVIAALVILFTPQHTVEIAGAAVTGIGMLGMKLLEKE
jgi:hypothetical protein